MKKKSFLAQKAANALSKLVLKELGIMQEDIDMLKKVKLTNVIPGEYLYLSSSLPNNDNIFDGTYQIEMNDDNFLNIFDNINTNMSKDRIVDIDGYRYVILKKGITYEIKGYFVTNCSGNNYHTYYIIDDKGNKYGNISQSSGQINSPVADYSNPIIAIITPNEDIKIKVEVFRFANDINDKSIIYLRPSYFSVTQVGVNLEYFNLYGATQDLSCNDPKMLIQAPAVKQLTDKWKKYLNAEYIHFSSNSSNIGDAEWHQYIKADTERSILHIFPNISTNISSDRIIEENNEKYVILKAGISYEIKAQIVCFCSDGNIIAHKYGIVDSNNNPYGNAAWTMFARVPNTNENDGSGMANAIITPEKDLKIKPIVYKLSGDTDESLTIVSTYSFFSIQQIGVDLDLVEED